MTDVADEALVQRIDEQSMVRVAYLAGDGRSGTTLLSRILGAYDGCLAVGELYDIWIERLKGDRICSCGAPLHECAFWNAVMDEAFGETEQRVAEHVMALRTSVQSVRHVPLVLFPWMRTPAFNRRLREYIDVMERLYVAIQNVSGCDVIVDSSKLAAYAVALSESPRIHVSLIHVTRDSRACAYSWRRLKREPTQGDVARLMRRRSLSRSAVVWAIRNAILGLVSRRFAVTTRLRYEDFVRQPREAATTLADQLGIDPDGSHWTGDSELRVLNASHIFAGNPNRVEQGEIRIRVDDEWRARMSRTQIALVSTLTLPVLWKLGYLGGPQTTPVESLPDTVLGKPQP